MIGLLVELLISWILLWLISKKHLSVLGFKPTRTRLTQLGVGLLMAASCCISYQLISTRMMNNRWVFNTALTGTSILEFTRWTLVSVLYEELIFRGALLYIAIEKLHIKKACFLSAIGFGIYHWFTFNVIGNPLLMIMTFLITGIVGLLWAFAFAKTKSMYLPVGLHFGWNFINTVLFSNAQKGKSIFVLANENQLQGLLSWMGFFIQFLVFLLLTYWYLNRLSKKEAMQINHP